MIQTNSARRMVKQKDVKYEIKREKDVLISQITYNVQTIDKCMSNRNV